MTIKVRHGKARLGLARQGKARPGEAGRGTARRGKDEFSLSQKKAKINMIKEKNMRKDEKKLLELRNELILVLVLVLLAFSLIYVVYYSMGKENTFSIPANESCRTNSIIEASGCLKEELKTFYVYNRTNIGKILSFEELKEEGGVCSHFSEWYAVKLKEMGFEAEKISIYNKTAGHVFVIAYQKNMTAYCILDQMEVYCVKLR